MEHIKHFRDIVLDELKKRRWSRKDLALRIGIDSTLINSMLRGERRFNEDQVMAIADAFNVAPFRLFTTESLLPESRARDMIRQAKEFQDNFQLVEEIEPIACGNLSHIGRDSIVGYKVFEKKYLKGMFKPFLTRASGDSMFPTLSQGDLLLFNRDPDKLQAPDPNRIYLVNLSPGMEEPHLTIKRVEFSKVDWSLTIIPDNRQYPIEKYAMSEKHSVLDYIIGIATWIGKELDPHR